jgi:beta-glucanase (GH16 family)
MRRFLWLAMALLLSARPASAQRPLTAADTTAIVDLLTTEALRWLERPGSGTVAFSPRPPQEPWLSLVARALRRVAPTRVTAIPTRNTHRLSVQPSRSSDSTITFALGTNACYDGGGRLFSMAGNMTELVVVRSPNGWRTEYADPRRQIHGDGQCSLPLDESRALPSTATPPALPGYVLAWHDEFNVDGPPDTAHWIPELGFVRNRELQWYQTQNATVKDGVLILEGRRERVRNPNYDATAPESDWKRAREFADYTSASFKTMGKHRWTYGRFEMRGRIDVRLGLWPAFWTVGSGTPTTPARPWPANGEIDIMEFFNGLLLGNAAWASARAGVATWDDVRLPIDSFARVAGYVDAAAWAADFHVWRMDWDAQWIRLYADDILLNEIPIAAVRNATADGANPFTEPHHVILNLAIGATGGDPSATPFPVRFAVDWVRVYQRRGPP